MDTDTDTERDEQPGTKTADPAEGKRDDAPDAPVMQPGTKTQTPAEGADNASGATSKP